MTDVKAVTGPELPGEFVGKLEADHRCRSWVPNENRYCPRPAGEGTYHEGEGRCASHDGRPPVHGAYSQYRQLPATLQDVYQEHLDAGEHALDVLGDIALARTVLQDYVVRYQETRDAIAAFYDWWMSEDRPGSPPKFELMDMSEIVRLLKDIVGMAHRERKLRAENTIPRAVVIGMFQDAATIMKRWLIDRADEDMTPEERWQVITEDWNREIKIPVG